MKLVQSGDRAQTAYVVLVHSASGEQYYAFVGLLVELL